MLKEPAGDCVASLVVCHNLSLVRLEDVGFLFHACDDPFDSLLEVFHVDVVSQLTSSDEGGFVADVSDVSACETWKMIKKKIIDCYIIFFLAEDRVTN